jgi:hypothetical protein
MTTQEICFTYLKKRLRLWCIIFFTLIITSCKTDTKAFDSFNESDFAEIIELRYSILELDQILMRPINIHISGNFLILQNLGPEYFYEIYDINTNKRINECITVGQGPGEMIAPKIVNIINNHIWIYDAAKFSFFEYKLEDFVAGHKPTINKTIKLKSNHINAYLMPEDKIIASESETLGCRFDFYTVDGKFLYAKGEYPPHSSLPEIEKRRYYEFDYTISIDSKIFVTHYYADIIEIYDREGNLIKRRQGPNQHKPQFEKKSVKGGDAFVMRSVKDETYQCYSVQPVNVGNEIFVLYFGGLYQNFEERCDRILVFDTDGNPLRIYTLKIPVITFTVDSEKKIIYGITDKPEKEDDEYNIIKYAY